jgi:uncharacterized protein YggE
MSIIFTEKESRRIASMLIILLGLLAVFFLVRILVGMNSMSSASLAADKRNTITVTGEGEMFAIPDTATFTFSVEAEANDVTTAQEQVTTKTNTLIDFLKKQGVADKNIKTVNYQINPRYEYHDTTSGAVYAPGERVLAGYDVMQTIEVKTEDTDLAGTLLTGVGQNGATQVSGLSFTIEDEDAVQAQARRQAIEKAEAQAREIADALGVRLVRVVNFAETTNNPQPYPAVMYDSAMAAGAERAVANVPTGENRVVSNVQVTYAIR